MLVRCKQFANIPFLPLLLKKVEESRFTLSWGCVHHKRYGPCVEIKNVRLRVAKDYCGQHPNECLNNFKKHRKGRWLEGADWVGFNDMLNDVLDSVEFDGNVITFNREAGRFVGGKVKPASTYLLRRGRCRRVDYQSEWVSTNSFTGGFFFWVADGTFEDWCGKEAPRSEFPRGTPGLAEWRRGADATAAQV